METRDLLAGAAAGPLTLPVHPPLPPTIAPPSQAPPIDPSAGPTVAFVQFQPLTGRVLVAFSGDMAGYNPATLTDPANYSFALIKPFTRLPSTPQSRPRAGVVLVPEVRITGVALPTPVAPGMVQSVVVTVNNNQPLREGIYRLTISSAGITDLAGRPLDGEFSGQFPSGEGQPGGDFVANLIETQHSVLPAMPVNPQANPAAPRSQVFVPTVSAVRVGYTSATPGQFMLAGGNNITLYTIPRDILPGASFPTHPRTLMNRSHAKAK